LSIPAEPIEIRDVQVGVDGFAHAKQVGVGSTAKSKQLRISIVVHGRFHAFDLVRALQARADVDVQLLTNYSAAACARFGIDPARVRSFYWHRLLQALANRVSPWFSPAWVQAYLHQSFGAWATRELEQQTLTPDVIRVFSGVAEELLDSPKLTGIKKVLTRGSSHICLQHQLLHEEAVRAGTEIDKPSPWMIARELREYEKSDAVLVLSRFAQLSFLHEGFAAERLWLIQNAVNLDWYRASPEVMQARVARVRSGAKLRVLMVGSFSFRKGLLDFFEIVSALKLKMQFRFVGDVPSEGRRHREWLNNDVEFKERVAPQALSEEYAWGDVFIFPTIEDGFPAVLAQALAAGLAVITTPNGSGPDLITDGENGWIVAARNNLGMIERLRALDANRESLLDCAREARERIAARSWDVVAEEFVATVRREWQY
jgi:glycosyltransferase involved in cell wall biosynthesis